MDDALSKKPEMKMHTVTVRAEIWDKLLKVAGHQIDPKTGGSVLAWKSITSF